MKGVLARTYSANYFQQLTLESWYCKLQQTPLNRCQQVPAPYKRLVQDKCRVRETFVSAAISVSATMCPRLPERSKPTNEDDRLCTSIPINTIKA